MRQWMKMGISFQRTDEGMKIADEIRGKVREFVKFMEHAHLKKCERLDTLQKRNPVNTRFLKKGRISINFFFFRVYSYYGHMSKYYTFS